MNKLLKSNDDDLLFYPNMDINIEQDILSEDDKLYNIFLKQISYMSTNSQYENENDKNENENNNNVYNKK